MTTRLRNGGGIPRFLNIREGSIIECRGGLGSANSEGGDESKNLW